MRYISTTGGPDSIYDRTHIWQTSPWESNTERLVTDMLAALTSPEVLQSAYRPPEQLFPPRYGYRTAALGIGDIPGLDDIYPQRADSSGSRGGYQGTSFPSLSQY